MILQTAMLATSIFFFDGTIQASKISISTYQMCEWEAQRQWNAALASAKSIKSHVFTCYISRKNESDRFYIIKCDKGNVCVRT